MTGKGESGKTRVEEGGACIKSGARRDFSLSTLQHHTLHHHQFTNSRMSFYQNSQSENLSKKGDMIC